MADGEAEDFRCFVGGLSWSTTDKALEDAFRPFGSVLETKVMPFSQAISPSL
jgi:heterogeneous nuclear ribonucleoprotein G